MVRSLQTICFLRRGCCSYQQNGSTCPFIVGISNEARCSKYIPAHNMVHNCSAAVTSKGMDDYIYPCLLFGRAEPLLTRLASGRFRWWLGIHSSAYVFAPVAVAGPSVSGFSLPTSIFFTGVLTAFPPRFF